MLLSLTTDEYEVPKWDSVASVLDSISFSSSASVFVSVYD